MYKYLLFDADNTLLDFDAAEKQALRETLNASPLGFSDEIHSRYHIINDNEWKKLERGETTREKLAVERFVRLYGEFGMDGNEYGAATAKIYTENLAHQYQLMPNAEQVLDTLSRKRYMIYIVTNGITKVQNSRLKNTPLEKFVLHSFISQEMSCAKPSPVFFDKVTEFIGDSDRTKYLVIGDSETGDIAGAVNAGMDSVRVTNGKDVQTAATYTVRELTELYNIL